MTESSAGGLPVPQFFRFFRECMVLLGLRDTPEEMDLFTDENWFFCFDDGMTAEQAVAEYRASHPARSFYCWFDHLGGSSGSELTALAPELAARRYLFGHPELVAAKHPESMRHHRSAQDTVVVNVKTIGDDAEGLHVCHFRWDYKQEAWIRDL